MLRRIYGQEEVLQLLVTFALFMILEDVQKLVWGVQPVSQDAPLQALGTVDVPFGDDTIPFTAYQLFVLPGVALATLARPRLVPAADADRPGHRRRDHRQGGGDRDGHRRRARSPC